MEGTRHRQVVSSGPRSSDALSRFIAQPFKYPKTTAAGVLWLLGLFVVFLAPAPLQITSEMVVAYEAKLSEAKDVLVALTKAEERLMTAELDMKSAKAWFWRWREGYRRRVEAKRPALNAARKEVLALRQQRDHILRQAKRKLGLWSEAGLEESRALLWENFNLSKDFAKRQTFWETLFNVLYSRDKDWIYLLFQLLLTALVNYTIGAVVSVISFALSLPYFLYSFAPSWPSAVVFYIIAMIGAISMVATYLAMIYAAGTAVAITTGRFASAQRARLIAAERRRPDAIRGPGAGAYRSHYE
jgi:hypothetical protein